MVHCEKCGSVNEDESFFCSSCGGDLPRSQREPIEFGKSQVDNGLASPVKPPKSLVKSSRSVKSQFESSKRYFFGKRAQKLPKKDKAQAIQSVMFGLVIITIALGLALPEATNLIFGIGFTLIALLFLYYRSLLSSRDPIFFVAVASAVLTVGLSLMLSYPTDSESPPVIFGIGFTITTLIYIYYRSRISERDPVFFVAIGVAVITLGLALTIQSSEPIILGLGFGLMSLVYIYYRYRISDRDPILFIIMAIVVVTIGFAMALGDDPSIVFAIGFGLIGMTLIINGVIRPMIHSYNST
ncbi:MAG: zinc ribbon domain-containing protein [Candidatus Heimdallarchaeota archaeon]|nr:MAG: zinc ribbon domain-containing protein [Candidatus Heimdallarchaeota archaeon]